MKGDKHLTRETLEELQRQISEHFYNEAKILLAILEADLSSKEWKKLKMFMENHPYHEAYEYLKNLSNKLADSK